MSTKIPPISIASLKLWLDSGCPFKMLRLLMAVYGAYQEATLESYTEDRK